MLAHLIGNLLVSECLGLLIFTTDETLYVFSTSRAAKGDNCFKMCVKVAHTVDLSMGKQQRKQILLCCTDGSLFVGIFIDNFRVCIACELLFIILR